MWFRISHLLFALELDNSSSPFYGFLVHPAYFTHSIFLKHQLDCDILLLRILQWLSVIYPVQVKHLCLAFDVTPNFPQLYSHGLNFPQSFSHAESSYPFSHQVAWPFSTIRFSLMPLPLQEHSPFQPLISTSPSSAFLWAQPNCTSFTKPA